MSCVDENRRVIALLDIDHFEIQIRGKQAGISPEDLRVRPVVAEGDFITSVNQAAKDIGIRRGPSLKNQNYNRQFSPLVLKAPRKYGKAEKLSLRKAGDDIYDLIVATTAKTPCMSYCYKCHKQCECIVEKSNCDEYFIDLTHEVNLRLDECYAVHLGQFTRMDMEGARSFKLELPEGTFDTKDHRKFSAMYYAAYTEVQRDAQLFALMHGAEIVAEVLDAVHKKLGYTLSAGIGGNKLFAKLACHRSKPNGLAVLPTSAFKRIQEEMTFTKIPGLGGDSGTGIEQNFPQIKTIGEFRDSFYKQGLWKWLDPGVRTEIYDKCNGIDNTPVVPKYLLPKITCGKTMNTNKKNRVSTMKQFFIHLDNRYREMRDYLLYENDRRNRMPQYLRLDIYAFKQRGNGRVNIFSTEVNFYVTNMEKLKRWRKLCPENDDLGEWAPMVGIFEERLYQDATLPLFRKDGAHIHEICRIELVAYF